MIEELGPEARALLDAAREGLSPDAAAVTRVRAQVRHAAVAGSAGTAVGLKLLVVGIVGAVAAVVAGGVYLRSSLALSAAPRVELASPAVAITTEPASPVVREPAPPAGADDALITIEAAPSVAASRHLDPAPAPPHRASSTPAPASRRGVAAKAIPRGAAAARPATDLAREVELVDLAMAALRRGDPGTALVTVQRHAAETAGNGQLAEDAAAIEIEALCQLHDPARAAKLTAFDARFPRSAQRSRLDRSCR